MPVTLELIIQWKDEFTGITRELPPKWKIWRLHAIHDPRWGFRIAVGCGHSGSGVVNRGCRCTNWAMLLLVVRIMCLLRSLGLEVARILMKVRLSGT